MKSFFSKMASGLKVKRTPRASCDCSDFIQFAPAAPALEYLTDVVRVHHFGGAHETVPPIEQDRRDLLVRSTVFDLRHRCGAEGRCTCAGAPNCRFPSCFTMRPLTKGAEIQAERMAYEVEDAPTASIRALVQLAKAGRLEDVAKGIQHLVNSEITAAAGGRPLDARLIISEEVEFTPGTVKMSQERASEAINPLSEDVDLRQEIIDLYLWRAALLVNQRQDESAVNSLLNLADVLETSQRTKLYSAAASWACLNDMEVIYYRSLLQHYESFPVAESFARERPMLLPRLFEALKHDDYHTDYCTHIVFSKEVTCTVSRAQAAQVHGDVTEDPMKSLCIPLSMHYYRFRVSDAFWKRFFDLLCMPPVPPPTPEEASRQAADPATELGLTPNHILDAVGRSMMLHHLVLFADTRQKEIDKGVVADRVRLLQGRKVPPQESDYNPVLEQSQMRIAITRMQQLLMVARTFEEGERSRLSGDDAPQRRNVLPSQSKGKESPQ